MYQVRRLFVTVSRSADDEERFNDQKLHDEIIGMYANPRFFAAVKDAEKNVKKDTGFKRKLEKAIAGSLIPVSPNNPPIK